MLKSRLTAEQFAALDDGLKGYYKEVNGKYVLQTDDAEELRQSAAAARQERDELKARLDAIQADIDAAKAAEEAAREEAARKAKDLPAIEASWQAKLDKQKADGEAENSRLRKMLTDLLVVKEAEAIAAAISTMPKIMAKEIASRLTAEFDGDRAITRVLDKDGRASALSLVELREEFVANPEYAGIIKGSNGGGGGAANHDPNGGAGTGKDFTKLSEKERVALHQTNPQEFKRLAEAAGVHIVR